MQRLTCTVPDFMTLVCRIQFVFINNQRKLSNYELNSFGILIHIRFCKLMC